MSEINLSRIRRYYNKSITIPIINTNRSKKIENIRMTLRQGDGPSTVWYGYGIDPLLNYLEKRLQGITLQTITKFGPMEQGKQKKLEKVKDRYILMGYCDDLKPAITCIEDFYTIEKAVTLYEQSSGCKLHRDIKSKKCKILLLGKWKDWH